MTPPSRSHHRLTPADPIAAFAQRQREVGRAETMAWRPIGEMDDAGKEHDWFLLMGGRITRGRWDKDEYAKKPRPHWKSERGYLLGNVWDRDNQPTHFMPLPPPPQPRESGTDE